MGKDKDDNHEEILDPHDFEDIGIGFVNPNDNLAAKKFKVLMEALRENLRNQPQPYQLDQSKSYVYFIFNEQANAIKIGRTERVAQRLQTLQTGNVQSLTLLYYIEESEKINEKSLHIRFHHLRLKDNREWFLATKEILNFIKELDDK